MLTKFVLMVWQCVGSVEVVGMHLTGSIVIFVSLVLRHIRPGHRTKTSRAALVGVRTRMNVVLRGINVKVNVVNPQPLTLP